MKGLTGYFTKEELSQLTQQTRVAQLVKKTSPPFMEPKGSTLFARTHHRSIFSEDKFSPCPHNLFMIHFNNIIL
jgi:hypothetical protein